jgi:nicotinate phosphoribosyltransferase
VKSSSSATTLLVDTYDTARAVRRVIEIEREIASSGGATAVRAIRIDSGDLGAQAKLARGMLDAANCAHIKIVLSGGLEERSIEALVGAGVPVDVFGVGTALDASSDAPTLDMVYKLVEYAGKPRRKRSLGKATWPGAKQVHRLREDSRRLVRDRICLADEPGEGEPLLIPVMQSGRRIGTSPSLPDIQRYCRREVAALPLELHRLDEEIPPFPVLISDSVRKLATEVDQAD